MAPELLGRRTGLCAPQRECRKGVRRRTPGPDCTSGAPMRQLPCDLEFSSQSTSWASPPQWQDEPKWLPLNDLRSTFCDDHEVPSISKERHGGNFASFPESHLPATSSKQEDRGTVRCSVLS